MLNLAPPSEIIPPPKQFHTLQPKSAIPPLAETHTSSNPELIEPHLIVQAAQELNSVLVFKTCLLKLLFFS